MFFRKITTKKNGKEYVYVKLIENYRMEGKVKQRVIANFGSIDNLSPERINYLIASLRKLHNELDIQDKESAMSLGDSRISEVRNILSSTGIKGGLVQVLGEGQTYEVAEAMLLKSLLAGEVNSPIQESCKELGFINATSLQFYQIMKQLGEERTRAVLNTGGLLYAGSNEIIHKPRFVSLTTGIFEGTSFEMDLPGSLFYPQNYQKPFILLLACDIQGFVMDFEYAEEKKEIQDRLHQLIDRLACKTDHPMLVLDGENLLSTGAANYLVAREVPEDINNNQNHEVLQGKQFFTTVSYEQKSPTQMKEVKANLAKACAGLETIKADILLGNVNKEAVVRRKAESVIKTNNCQDMVSFSFNELTQTFEYQINEEAVKQKNQSIITQTWVVEPTAAFVPVFDSIPVKTSTFRVITDQLKMPPINMYVDYHYSPEIISGHIQLEIIKQKITRTLNESRQGGEA
ncbi:hypothetical protein [Desulforamulus ruminis]|uniref:Uncharacterized protein n=1 Tax=Desulforamulus ruminis (strain ATCC 23193 / DSM 2154 / NCIMB 8452 / DL) TaxID=696281 RepID=F6DQG4_DESRL|nr:hypothetical protein [Desulforamulus ruminis]AEG60858.1 hypothetical protein Desru_2632 [Desulforamulus ruminis DSM 2154]